MTIEEAIQIMKDQAFLHESSQGAIDQERADAAQLLVRTVEAKVDRPTIVCLCGSTRFYETFRKANLSETLAGRIILTIGCDFKSDDALNLNTEDKQRLDELHKRKIDLCDEVLILNDLLPWCEFCRKFRHECYPCNHAFEGRMLPYIGESTRSEIEYATSLGKRIRWLNPPLEVLPST